MCRDQGREDRGQQRVDDGDSSGLRTPVLDIPARMSAGVQDGYASANRNSTAGEEMVARLAGSRGRRRRTLNI